MSAHFDSRTKNRHNSSKAPVTLPRWPARLLPEDYWAELVALQHRWNEKKWPLFLIQIMTMKCVIECWWGLNRIKAENRWSQINEKAHILRPLGIWIESIPIENKQRADRVVSLIPADCPFERDIRAFGKTFHVPPLCKFNPLYEPLTMLRFKAMCYLVDECGEDAASLT